jgi:hypothetical protein
MTPKMSQADQAVAFARPDRAAGGQVTWTYRMAIRELSELPYGSGITWYQNVTEDGLPFSPVLGTAEQTYPDGSKLAVMIRTDPPAYSPRQFEIATSLIITAPGGGQRKIDYDIEPGAGNVICREDPEYGETLARITASAEQLVTSGLGQPELEEMMSAALTEIILAEQGLDPSLDLVVEELRAANEVYRRQSDEMRAAQATRADREHQAGMREIIGLGLLLRSL